MPSPPDHLRRLQPGLGLRDLRILASQVEVLGGLAQDIRAHRTSAGEGGGFTVLFAGGSNTSKAVAAEALAHELGWALYRVDLSAVVSKYIGETEKNLRRLFDAAEQGGAVLFFDEADALFGTTEATSFLDHVENVPVVSVFSVAAPASPFDPDLHRRLRVRLNF